MPHHAPTAADLAMNARSEAEQLKERVRSLEKLAQEQEREIEKLWGAIEDAAKSDS